MKFRAEDIDISDVNYIFVDGEISEAYIDAEEVTRKINAKLQEWLAQAPVVRGKWDGVNIFDTHSYPFITPPTHKAKLVEIEYIQEIDD